MAAGTTKSGFSFDVNPAMLSDWRVASAIAETQGDDDAAKLTGAVKLVKLLLGKAEADLCEHVKREDGTVQTEDVMREVGEIMEALRNESDSVKK